MACKFGLNRTLIDTGRRQVAWGSQRQSHLIDCRRESPTRNKLTDISGVYFWTQAIPHECQGSGCWTGVLFEIVREATLHSLVYLLRANKKHAFCAEPFTADNSSFFDKLLQNPFS